MNDVGPAWTGRVLLAGAVAVLFVSACGSSTDASTHAAVSGATVPLGPLPAPPSGPTPASDTATTTIRTDVAPTADPNSPLTPVVSPSSTPATATVAPLQGCARVTSTATIDGRVVNIESPETTSPAAVIVAVHGYKGTPEGLAHYSSLTTLADAGMAMVLYPAGAPLDLGFGWNSGATKFATTAADDVAVLSDIVDEALTLPCADPSRVYLVGESNGGGMVLRAACDTRLAGRLSGIVLVNPAIDAGVLSTCSPIVPTIPVLAVAGALDRVVGFDGSRKPFIAAESWFGSVASIVSGCAGSSPRVVSLHVIAHDGSGCASCATLYAIDDGGHTWPGAADAVNGAAIGSFPLTDVLGRAVTRAVNGCGA